MDINLGVDFDNTIVNYEDVLFDSALRFGWIKPDTARDKKTIRDRIRELPDGEIKWQKLQAHVYGKGMTGSRLFDGVKPFFDACRKAGIDVSIVSHKTQFASMDEEGIDLRDTALDWMAQNRFFDDDGLGLSRGQVFFESTRERKIERIRKLKCTHFIDDLEETFLEAAFPSSVEKILYAKDEPKTTGVKACRSWKEIYDHFFAR